MMEVDKKTLISGYCSARPPERQVFPSSVGSDRLDAIFRHDKKWANGTKLRYYFFTKKTDGEERMLSNGTIKFSTWVGSKAQQDIVRKAFRLWKKVGIGLEFTEVNSREDAEVRIGFMQGDGSWSYLGRDILNRGKNQRTMNFGWDLRNTDGLDTATHEIGHTLGMPHEHQNPNAGIIWDEPAVIRDLAGPPNFWDESKTRHNIINKIEHDSVIGSEWDRNSIMHYPFRAGMILRPQEFQTKALVPKAGLSQRDKAWVKHVYPKIRQRDITPMFAFTSVPMSLSPGQQFNGFFTPEESRKYTIQTFGSTDTVLTLFEETDNEERFIAGDDDSGQDFNAKVSLRLQKGRTYLIRLRLFYSWDQGTSAIMVF